MQGVKKNVFVTCVPRVEFPTRTQMQWKVTFSRPVNTSHSPFARRVHYASVNLFIFSVLALVHYSLLVTLVFVNSQDGKRLWMKVAVVRPTNCVLICGVATIALLITAVAPTTVRDVTKIRRHNNTWLVAIYFSLVRNAALVAHSSPANDIILATRYGIIIRYLLNVASTTSCDHWF